MGSNRISYLDFGIFFVVFGHVTHIGVLREYIWNFHMPLFFIVSGLLHKAGIPFKEFFLKRVKSIYIPYVLFFAVTYTYWALVERNLRGGGFSLLHQLLGLFYGNYQGNHLYFNGALWFLPCLFVVELLFYPIGKMHNKVGVVGALLLSFSVGWLLLENGIDYLPFGLHTAMFAIVFYGVGFLSKPGLEYVNSSSKASLWLAVAGCLAVQLLCIGNYSSTLQKCNLPYVLLALVGVFLYLSLSIMLGKSRLLEYLGRNSLVIFAFQELTYRAVIFVIGKLTGWAVEQLRTSLLMSVVAVCCAIALITPCVYIYNLYVRPRIDKLF